MKCIDKIDVKLIPQINVFSNKLAKFHGLKLFYDVYDFQELLNEKREMIFAPNNRAWSHLGCNKVV